MKDILCAICCTFVGGYVIYEASDYPKNGGVEMHPGHYPTILGYLLIVLAVALVIKTLVYGKAKASQSDMDRPRVAMMIGALVAYAGLMEVLGYLVTTFLFVTAGVILFHGSRKVALITGLLCAAALTVMFRYIFQAPLPAGFLL